MYKNLRDEKGKLNFYKCGFFSCFLCKRHKLLENRAGRLVTCWWCHSFNVTGSTCRFLPPWVEGGVGGSGGAARSLCWHFLRGRWGWVCRKWFNSQRRAIGQRSVPGRSFRIVSTFRPGKNTVFFPCLACSQESHTCSLRRPDPKTQFIIPLLSSIPRRRHETSHENLNLNVAFLFVHHLKCGMFPIFMLQFTDGASVFQDCWNLQSPTSRYGSDLSYQFMPSACSTVKRALCLCCSSGEVDQTNRRGHHRGPASHRRWCRHRGDVRIHLTLFQPLVAPPVAVFFLLCDWLLPSTVTCAWWCEAFRRWTVKLSPAPCWESSGKIRKPATSSWRWSVAEEDEVWPPHRLPEAWHCVCVCVRERGYVQITFNNFNNYISLYFTLAQILKMGL